MELLCLPISIQSLPPLFFYCLSQPNSKKRGDGKVDGEAQDGGETTISVEAFEPSNFKKKKSGQTSASGQEGLMGKKKEVTANSIHPRLCWRRIRIVTINRYLGDQHITAAPFGSWWGAGQPSPELHTESQTNGFGISVTVFCPSRRRAANGL